MLRAYKYRIYPNRLHRARMVHTLRLCRDLYNAALQERRDDYMYARVSVNYDIQARELPELKKEHPDYDGVYSQVIQDVMRRMEKAFDAFFLRVEMRKAGSKIKAGYPRFKPKHRYNSFTYPQTGFEILDDGHLKLTKLGTIRMFQHREIPDGSEIKTCTIKRDSVGDWFAIFVTEAPDVPIRKSRRKTKLGIDVGCDELVACSNGKDVKAPRFYRKAEAHLKRVQRAFSRTQKDSKRREKRRIKLARAHRKVARQRDDFLHKLSKKLSESADVVKYEDLRISNMLKNHALAKSIADASWRKLMTFTTYKAESAGRAVEFVDAKGTSQECSKCGNNVPKPLSEERHKCPFCGFDAGRHRNAALNIKKRPAVRKGRKNADVGAGCVEPHGSIGIETPLKPKKTPVETRPLPASTMRR